MMSLTTVPSSISATHLFVRFIRAAAIPAERSKPEPKRHAKAFDALAMRTLAQMSHNCYTLNLNANTETPMSTLKLRQVTGSRWNVYGSASKFKLCLQHSRPVTNVTRSKVSFCASQFSRHLKTTPRRGQRLVHAELTTKHRIAGQAITKARSLGPFHGRH